MNKLQIITVPVVSERDKSSFAFPWQLGQVRRISKATAFHMSEDEKKRRRKSKKVSNIGVLSKDFRATEKLHLKCNNKMYVST